MTTLDIRTPEGTTSGTVELPASVFDVQVNIPLIHQVVVAQLAAARQGTASTKSRGEVSGGGRKPYRQKGTGRARQGSIRAPQFVGGGVVHGPTPRDYSQRTPKKMIAAALRGALSDRARGGKIHVVTQFAAGEAPSTKTAISVLLAIASSRHVLVVAERTDAQTWKSLRNVESVHLISPGQLNTYDVLVSDDVVFTAEALESFLARTAPGSTVIVEAPAAVEAPAKKAPAKKAAAAKPAAVVEEALVVEEPAGDLDDATLEATTTDELEPAASSDSVQEDEA